MRAVLRGFQLDPDPATLPSDPAEFFRLAQLLVGPADGPGEESFDVTVCTPEWLSAACREAGGLYNPDTTWSYVLTTSISARCAPGWKARVEESKPTVGQGWPAAWAASGTDHDRRRPPAHRHDRAPAPLGERPADGGRLIIDSWVQTILWNPSTGPDC